MKSTLHLQASLLAMRFQFRSFIDLLSISNTLSYFSKKVNRKDDGGWYGTHDFRYKVVSGLESKLNKGEILYFEIVGWANEETTIMPSHDVTKTGLQDIKKKYGNSINYTYDCQAGDCKLYVYRISLVNEDGIVVEQPWGYVVRRCGELGIPHVPLLFGPTTLSHLAHIQSTDGHEALRRTVETYTSGPSTLNPAQIREGVVIRVENKLGISHIKNKSFEFGVLEGYLAEDESFVDPEDVS